MERKVRVVLSNGKVASTITADVTTFGDLKEVLLNNNVDLEGMSVYEGFSKGYFENDEQILPTNIPFKGGVTNELALYVTAKGKKIASGSERSDLYNEIKALIAENPENANIINQGKNYTNKKTSELKDIVASLKSIVAEEDVTIAPTEDVNEVITSMKEVVDTLNSVINKLEGVISYVSKAPDVVTEVEVSDADILGLF